MWKQTAKILGTIGLLLVTVEAGAAPWSGGDRYRLIEVRDAVTNAPITGATVQHLRQTGAYFTPVGTQTTDFMGRVTIPRTPGPGRTNRVIISHPGYRVHTEDFRFRHGPHATPSMLTVRLSRDAIAVTIRGRVRNSRTGQPVSGATVQVLTRQGGILRPIHGATAYTSHSGRFRISAFLSSDRRYRVHISAAGYQTQSHRVSVAHTGGAVALSVSLIPMGPPPGARTVYFYGTVRDAVRHTWLPWTRVQLQVQSGGLWSNVTPAPTTTDSLGRYNFYATCYPGAAYRLQVTGAGYHTALAPANLGTGAHVQTNLELWPIGSNPGGGGGPAIRVTIHGRVVDAVSGRSIRGAQIQLLIRSQGAWRPVAGATAVSRRPFGHFNMSVNLVRGRSYRVGAAAPGFQPRTARFVYAGEPSVNVQLSLPPVAGPPIVLSDPLLPGPQPSKDHGAVIGSVYSRLTNRPIAGARVTFREEDDEYPPRTVQTDVNGRFAIWLRDSDWKMTVTVGPQSVRAGEVEVDDGEVERVRLWF